MAVDAVSHLDELRQVVAEALEAALVNRPVSEPAAVIEDGALLLNGAAVDQRYNISSMTRWRWRRDKSVGFPEPAAIINGRHYYSVADLHAFEVRRFGKVLSGPRS